MKKIFIYILIAFSFNAISQNISVLDKTTLQPLSNVAIFNPNKDKSTTTNAKGVADISEFIHTDSIVLQHAGYQNKVLSYEKMESLDFEILMSTETYSLDEIIVSASKFEEKRSEIPQQIMVLKSKDLQFMNQQTTADVIQNSGNILVQKSQLGGGSPVIRGFEANKVLMVVDGVRMNNAIYRGGHLQNIISMDNTILDKTEIVFGPGSVVYGSDALGGVIHFHTKNPLLSDDLSKTNISSNVFTRYSSAYTEKTGHLDFNIGLQKVGFLTSFTYSDFGDLHQGNIRNPFYGDWGKRIYYVERVNGTDSMIANDDVNLQKQSGYKQYDFLEKILYRQNDYVDHVINIQYSTSSDIPRYDRLTDMNSSGTLKNAQWYYGPQKRLFSSYSLNINKASKLYNKAKIILGYQNIEESRNNRSFGNNNLNHRIENVEVLTLNADFSKNINKQELRYGIEGTYNIVHSSAFSEDITTGNTSPIDTRYPDGGSTMQTLAAYLTHTFEISDKIILNDGIRYSNIQLHSTFNDTSFFPFPFNEVQQKSGALNGNIGLTLMPGKDWRFTILGSSGFRAPNVDDLSKVFESVPGSIIIPNPDLKPEYTYNGEIGISKIFNKQVRLEAIGYYTLYMNALTTMATTFNGQDSIVYDGTLSKVTATVNADQAYICGLNLNMSADVTDAFSIVSTLNYSYGRVKTDSIDFPLDHIPPVFGKTSFNLSIKKFRGEFFVMYNGPKLLKDYSPSGEDNLQYATIHGMPAWLTLNVRTAYQINKHIQVQASLENILDTNYRIFASGIGAAGRNFIITLRGNF